MQLVLSVPGKTFLAGEYSILNGGPAIVLSTKPNFELIVDFNSSNLSEGVVSSHIHPESPAGKILRENSHLMERCSFTFRDPWNLSGGLGASGAQFLLVSAVRDMLAKEKKQSTDFLTLTWLKECWEQLRHSEKKQKSRASGADIVSQFNGGVTYFSFPPFSVESLSWNFSDLSFLIFHTGKKIKTHKHLSEESPLKWPQRELTELVVLLKRSFQEQNSQGFIEIVSAYSKALVASGLVLERTQEICRELMKLKGVRLAKGCGALGADTVLLIIEKEEEAVICETLSSHLSYRGGLGSLGEGISIRVNGR